MLFSKYIALVALPILAVATPMPGGASPTTKPATTTKVETTTKVATTTVTITATATATEGVSQCNTGSIQCCNSVQQASSPAVTSLLGLLGVVVQDLNVLVGLNCSPLSIIGIGSASCSAAPVCCENNNFNGLISLGCIPISINL